MTDRFKMTPVEMAEQHAQLQNKLLVATIEDQLRAQLRAKFLEAAEPLILEAVEAAMHNLKVNATAYRAEHNMRDELHVLTTIKVE